MKLKTLRQAKIKGKKIIIRVDYNVPMSSDGKKVLDDTRIRESIPTIREVLKKGATQIILMSHIGRPKGKDKTLTTNAPSKTLEKILNKQVVKIDSIKKGCIPEKPKIIMLENLRFYDEKNKDEKKKQAFASLLASFGDIYINEAFSNSHRDHASMYGITKYLPSFAGINLEHEVKTLSLVFETPRHPLVLILGGAKIDTKIGLIKNFFRKADVILIGGALANTFLAARGFDIGKSLYEKDKIEIAQETMLMAEKVKQKLCIPWDCIVADKISEKAQKINIPVENVEGNMKILDIGKITIKRYNEYIKKSKMIIWNGPVGLAEYNRFSHGTKRIAEAIISSSAVSILGGGDTLAAIEKWKYPKKKFTHVSSAGGAMLEFLEGKELPALSALKTS